MLGTSPPSATPTPTPRSCNLPGPPAELVVAKVQGQLLELRELADSAAQPAASLHASEKSFTGSSCKELLGLATSEGVIMRKISSKDLVGFRGPKGSGRFSRDRVQEG